MKFRTEYVGSRGEITLDPERAVALLGSCFTQNIALKMTECGWETFAEAGTLYNPLSIARVLKLLLFETDSESSLRDSLFESEGYVHSWLFDSHFSRMTAKDVVDNVKESGAALDRTLRKAQALIVTFGTAWCYFLTEKEDYVVANCHKMPQRIFTRRRIGIEEISEEWTEMCRLLGKSYPGLRVIFTVSPVRHLKDGFEGNARSKATLLLAVEQICLQADNASYFPAYEIVNDDLRDYRFYAGDLVHPSEEGVEYLWEKFRETYVDTTGEALLKAGSKEFKRRKHKEIIRK